MVATTLNESSAPRPAPDTRCADATACRCGQQLDCCTHAHCPRCGRSITHR